LNTTSALLFYRIARNWKLIVRGWHEKEMVFLKKPYGCSKVRLRVKVNRLIVVLFFTGLGKYSFGEMSEAWAAAIELCIAVEHVFYQYQSITWKLHDAVYCNVTVNNPVDYFFIYEYTNVYRTVPYSLPLGILVHINNALLAFVRVFTDLFLIVVSICIRTRFEQLFERIKSAGAERTSSVKFWKDMRLHYLYILDILELANTHLPAIVFVSCFNNFYFICYQLINLTK
jgi:gustatory receptor